METVDVDGIRRAVDQQENLVRGLQLAIYSLNDPSSADSELQCRLAEEEARLLDLRRQQEEAAVRPVVQYEPAPRNRFLGPETTGLKVESTLNMQPIPTGVYHLLNPETDPLLTVVITNESPDPRRVCVKAYLEGLSAQDIRTVELNPLTQATLKLLPALLPRQARSVTEVQRATLHVLAEDLDGKTERHDTYSVVCLARTSSFNTVRRPDTGKDVDLTHYYGAWVTPHTESVQRVIRRAAEFLPDRMISGYQGELNSVTRQVEAMYRALKETGITYVNSWVDYGAAPGQATQRTRLPRESLVGRAANCIDGTVLFASLLEGATLNPAIVLVPGHAFVGWETWSGADEWRYLETTMIGTHDFEAACQSGHRQFDQAKTYGRSRLTVHRLADLRARGIYPME